MTLKQRLRDPSLLVTQAFVGGEWIGAANRETFAVTNPATGETVAEVPALGEGETRQAVAAADVAWPAWRGLPNTERARLLEIWHRLMLENADDLALIMTVEQGKPLNESRGEIQYGASFVKWFAEEARRINGDTIPAPTTDRRIIVLKEPVGVSAAITPWNFPNAMITRKCAPALAAGCPIIVKPSDLTPLSALALAVLAERSGFPKGVFNILTGMPEGIGQELTGNSGVRKLSFTGSTRAGRILMQQCAKNIKRVSFELGGDACDKGADVVVGATTRRNSLFASPTVLTGATTDMSLANEETFGPVAPIFRFGDEKEALAIANATPFGLAAYYFTQDLRRSWRVAERLEYGMVGLNTGSVSLEVAPFGGIKESGLGREGSKYGIDEYLEMKAFHIGSLDALATTH